MKFKKKSILIIIILSVFLYNSCQTGKKANADNKRIYVNSGSVMLVIQGQVNETKYLTKGQNYSFTLSETETVIINVTATDGNNAQITVSGYGNDRKFTVTSTDRSGLDLVFANR